MRTPANPRLAAALAVASVFSRADFAPSQTPSRRTCEGSAHTRPDSAAKRQWLAFDVAGRRTERRSNRARVRGEIGRRACPRDNHGYDVALVLLAVKGEEGLVSWRSTIGRPRCGPVASVNAFAGDTPCLLGVDAAAARFTCAGASAWETVPPFLSLDQGSGEGRIVLGRGAAMHGGQITPEGLRGGPVLVTFRSKVARGTDLIEAVRMPTDRTN
jgi:hypothetical protein